MAFVLLIIKSAFRNPLRTTLTALGVAIAIIAFLFLRTFIAAWYAGVVERGLSAPVEAEARDLFLVAVRHVDGVAIHCDAALPADVEHA